MARGKKPSTGEQQRVSSRYASSVSDAALDRFFQLPTLPLICWLPTQIFEYIPFLHTPDKVALAAACHVFYPTRCSDHTDPTRTYSFE
jgi:hypothetical protein